MPACASTAGTGENAAHTHLSSAPWNDGGLSFFTKERLALYTKNTQKVAVFQEKGAFFAISG
jgi:hypothetical protein